MDFRIDDDTTQRTTTMLLCAYNGPTHATSRLLNRRDQRLLARPRRWLPSFDTSLDGKPGTGPCIGICTASHAAADDITRPLATPYCHNTTTLSTFVPQHNVQNGHDNIARYYPPFLADDNNNNNRNHKCLPCPRKRTCLPWTLLSVPAWTHIWLYQARLGAVIIYILLEYIWNSIQIKSCNCAVCPQSKFHRPARHILPTLLSTKRHNSL